MNACLRLLCVSALALSLSTATANSHPLNGLTPPAVAGPVVKAHCWDDCWHYAHRSHWRYGSHHDWHSRARSHYRWGSYGGGYGHDRWYSHNRWGSYDRSCCGPRGYWPYD
jgi:hypothetical protein